MELNFKIIVLVIGILFTGITSGLCFTWGNAITPGIGRLNDLVFLQAFQAMNRVIINPTFLITFFGPAILLFINAYLHRNNPMQFKFFLAAAILFFVGVAVITVTKNVPLNEILDKATLETMTSVELKNLRTTFEEPWNRWHMIRTITSTLALLSLIIGLLYNK